ncbi:MAG TPA: methylmalonyl-CoA mutase family protein, partial [Thermoplasmata archaeon]|nr:methylmalonyl-CoA mutase family protein [Thermoplasmata archaeon]
MPTRRKSPSRKPKGRSSSVPSTSATVTASGVPLDVVAGPEPFDLEGYLRNLGFPGEPPYTRGIRATMYRGRLWTMRQYAGFGTASETNRRFKYLLSQGNEGLSVAFDLPTQMGYDGDAAIARGEVGRVGVAISSIENMRVLLADLPLERV